jgi:hypothetical protein
MNRRRQIVLGLALGMVGLWGVAMVAWGEGGISDTQRAEYVRRQASIDPNKADDLCGLARWCLQNKLPEEARTNAEAALQRSPDDLRAKYVLYALSATQKASGVDGTDTQVGAGKGTTISDEDVTRIINEEGSAQITRFGKEVLPRLVERCGAVKCHGDEKNPKWTLITKDLTDRKTIVENFQSINKFLSRDTVDSTVNSRFLQAPMKGLDAKHPTQVFRTATDPVYRTTEAWLRTLKTDIAKAFSSESTPASAVPTPTAAPVAPTAPTAPVTPGATP